MNKKVKILGLGIAALCISLFAFQNLPTSANEPLTYQQQIKESIKNIEQVRNDLQRSKDGDQIVFEINTKKITKEDFKLQTASMVGRKKSDIEDEFIKKYILISIAEERGIQVEEKEVYEFMENMRVNLHHPDFKETMQQFYAAYGYDEESYWKLERTYNNYYEGLLISKLLDSLYEDVISKSKDIDPGKIQELVREEQDKLVKEYLKNAKIISHNL